MITWQILPTIDQGGPYYTYHCPEDLLGEIGPRFYPVTSWAPELWGLAEVQAGDGRGWMRAEGSNYYPEVIAAKSPCSLSFPSEANSYLGKPSTP